MCSDKGLTCIYAQEHRLHLPLYYYRLEPHEKIITRKKFIINDKENLKQSKEYFFHKRC